MTKRILSGLIVLTMMVFALAYLATQQFPAAVPALAAGLIWLWQENSQQSVPAAPFFLFFLGLSVVGILSQLPVSVMLLGLCASLAAWDISRFRARVAVTGQPEIDPVLEQRHLRRLFTVIGAGLLITLLPVFVQLSISFVAFAVLTLLLLLVLRASVRALRHEPHQLLE